MNIGDLVGIGWNGKEKRPFPAIIVKLHPDVGYPPYYTVFVFSARQPKLLFVKEGELKFFEECLNI